MTSQAEFESIVAGMTKDVWERMRASIETGRWPDGRRLTDEQRALSLEAVLAWEIRNGVPEEERTGYLPGTCKSQAKDNSADPVLANAQELKVD